MLMVDNLVFFLVILNDSQHRRHPFHPYPKPILKVKVKENDRETCIKQRLKYKTKRDIKKRDTLFSYMKNISFCFTFYAITFISLFFTNLPLFIVVLFLFLLFFITFFLLVPVLVLVFQSKGVLHQEKQTLNLIFLYLQRYK